MLLLVSGLCVVLAAPGARRWRAGLLGLPRAVKRRECCPLERDGPRGGVSASSCASSSWRADGALSVCLFDGRAERRCRQGAGSLGWPARENRCLSVPARPRRPAERSGRVNNLSHIEPSFVRSRARARTHAAYFASWSVINTRSLGHNARAKKGLQ